MKMDMMTRKASMWTTIMFLIFFWGCIGPAQKLTPKDMSITRPDANGIVVVHSRSGNTAKAGLILSEKTNSDYIRLDVPSGSGDSLVSSPNRNDEVVIQPLKVDLSKYRLVFLGSPIWFRYPTVFIYTFIKNNNFTDRKVVLFYTNEGGLSDNAIDEWKALVQQKGGSVIDVIEINRKVVKTDDAIQSEVNAVIDKQRLKWFGANAGQ